MTLKSRAVAIVNPRSANGRTAREWPQVVATLEAALGPLAVDHTARPGHAIELTAARLQEGFRTVIAVGGDGTVNEVVNGFFQGQAARYPDAVLGIVPRGSGSDFWRSISSTVDDRHGAGAIKRGVAKPIDVGKVTYVDLDGHTCVRYYVNITSFGLGGAVAERANRSSKALGGTLSMLKATFIANLGYRKREVALVMDDGPPTSVKIINVAVGNGQYHGGRMRACPRAILDDGWLDVTVIGDVAQLDMVWSFPMLYSGRIYEHPKVSFHRVTRLRATAAEPTLIEIDGEALGRLPLEIVLLPKALSVYVPFQS